MRIKLLALPFFLLVLCGFSKEQAAMPAQPTEERKAQDALPKSKDPAWALLSKTKVHLDNAKGLYSADFPPEVKALVGKEFTISGFMLPLESTESSCSYYTKSKAALR